MARVIFITESYIKSNTVVDDNVNATTLLSIAYDAQEQYIEPLLGTRLYNKLKTEVTADTLTGDYLTLMNDYVVPTLIKWIEHDFIPENHYRLRNVGTTVKSGEFGQSASFSELKFRMDMASKKAELKGLKMIDYLTCNTSSFPEYTINDKGGEIPAINSAARTGWYLGNSKVNYGEKEKDLKRGDC